MAIPDHIDTEKLAEAALAILCLGAHQDGPGVRAWKGMDWDLMALLFERDWIQYRCFNPLMCYQPLDSRRDDIEEQGELPCSALLVTRTTLQASKPTR